MSQAMTQERNHAMSQETSQDWVRVCALTDLDVERGVGALIGEYQAAVFRLADGSVRAVQLHDPYSGANVLSRGIVGTHLVPVDLPAGGATAGAGDAAGAGQPEGVEVATLTSPVYKQVWDLTTGEVLDAGGKGEHPLAVFEARVSNGEVLVSLTPSADPDLGSDN